MFTDNTQYLAVLLHLWNKAHAACDDDIKQHRIPSNWSGVGNIASVTLVLSVMGNSFPFDVTAMLSSSDGIHWSGNDAISSELRIRKQQADAAEATRRQEQLRQQQVASAQAALASRGIEASGPLSAEVLQCVKEIFPRMGFSAPAFKGSPCSDFVGVYGVQTTDTRDTPNGVEVLANVTLQAIQPLAAQSMMAQVCYGGSQNDLRPGDTVRFGTRIQFEKWNSGLRCTTQAWAATPPN